MKKCKWFNKGILYFWILVVEGSFKWLAGGYWWSREVLSGSVQTFKAASAVFSIKF